MEAIVSTREVVGCPTWHTEIPSHFQTTVKMQQLLLNQAVSEVVVAVKGQFLIARKCWLAGAAFVSSATPRELQNFSPAK